MRQAGSFLILAAVAALVVFSFLPGTVISGPVLWGGLGLLCLAGGLIWWRDRRARDEGSDD